MPTSFSLAHLTVLGCAPDQMVHVAANAGYDHVSIRLIPLWTPGEPAYLPENKAMLHATRVAIAATGVTVLDLELARIRRDIDPKSFGGIGIIAIPNFLRFYRNVLIGKGFPHHT